MKAAVRYDQFSGSILIARNGLPLVSKSYGMANYELDVPNTPQTVFHIASLTKQFTAMAILQLQEQGKLKLSDPACAYLENCPAAWQPITIRQLLMHSSGIPNYSSLPNWDDELALKKYRHADFVKIFRDLPLDFTPGEKFKYSNSGYFLLGLIIERASGKLYGQFLHDGIFAPLGMTQTKYDDSRALTRNRATGYYSLGTGFIRAPYVDPTTTYSDGGITSTMGDMLRWDQALYTEKLVSRRSLDEMFTPGAKGYGYGWQIGEALGRKKADHSGSMNGFSTYILRFPAEKVTVIVLSNSDRTSAGKVGNGLAAITFGAEYKLPKSQLRDVLYDTIAQRGVGPGIQQYRDLERTQPGDYDFGEETLLYLGYDLIDGQKPDDAVTIFKLNIERFPKSAYSYDGLGDAVAARGEKQLAITYFEKSLTLDPDNTYAVKALERLRAGSSK